MAQARGAVALVPALAHAVSAAMSTSASAVFWIIVGSGIALVVVVVAIVFAQQQVGDVYARERTALFACMLREGSTALTPALSLCTTMGRSCGY